MVKNEAVSVTNITYFLPLNNLLLLSEEFPGSWLRQHWYFQGQKGRKVQTKLSGCCGIIHQHTYACKPRILAFLLRSVLLELEISENKSPQKSSFQLQINFLGSWPRQHWFFQAEKERKVHTKLSCTHSSNNRAMEADFSVFTPIRIACKLEISELFPEEQLSVTTEVSRQLNSTALTFSSWERKKVANKSYCSWKNPYVHIKPILEFSLISVSLELEMSENKSARKSSFQLH